MAFRFRLEKVMNYRQRLVDRQALELAEAGRVVAEISEQIRALSDEITGFESSFPPSITQVSVQERMNMVWWIEHLRGRHLQLKHDLTEALQEQETQRENMIRAWQDLEVLKKLKARQKELWSAEVLKRENQDLDEVGIQRADRKRREKLASV